LVGVSILYEIGTGVSVLEVIGYAIEYIWGVMLLYTHEGGGDKAENDWIVGMAGLIVIVFENTCPAP
jgi:hypothetical protein